MTISLHQAQKIVRAADKLKNCSDTLRSWKQPHVCANINKLDFKAHIGNRFWPDVLCALDVDNVTFCRLFYEWIGELLADQEAELKVELEEAQRVEK